MSVANPGNATATSEFVKNDVRTSLNKLALDGAHFISYMTPKKFNHL